MGQANEKCVRRGFTRREVLGAGGLLVPAGALIPGLFSRAAHAQAASSTFDYYISPTGSDSNPGTLSSPWSVTAINSKQSVYAGRRVGFLPGTYDVSSFMGTDTSNPDRTPVMNINGGTSDSARTYLGSSDASGNYSPRTATFDAKGASGLYGGGNSKTTPIMGCNDQVANAGYWTVDGLRFMGFSFWAFHVSASPGGGVNVHNWTIQNCEFFGGSGQYLTNASGVNLAPLVIYTAYNGLVTNNYFHDNEGWSDPDHFSAVYQWGEGTSTHDIVYTYNTFINSGNLHGKENTQYNNTIAYNYIDMTKKTPSGGADQNAAAIFGFNADNGQGTLTTIHHNILLSQGAYICTDNDTGQNGWYTPVQVYNNTFVNVGANESGAAGFVAYEMAGGSRPVTFYNNLYYDNGQTTGGYGYILVPYDVFKLSDYNIYGGQNGNFSYVGAAAQSSSGETTTTFASWKAVTGTDAHSSMSGSNPFTNNGAYANQYKVGQGSPAYQTGRVGGSATGAVCNVGAWDGTVTQIGCNFAGGAVVPEPPQLSIS